mmetsp:Transcript_22128/g.77560  ORF Transcript_22128/g.77560 Transcript_22128/m.77560 type:complete len:208 (+) Transcript_22128:340-963(+)
MEDRAVSFSIEARRRACATLLTRAPTLTTSRRRPQRDRFRGKGDAGLASSAMEAIGLALPPTTLPPPGVARSDFDDMRLSSRGRRGVGVGAARELPPAAVDSMNSTSAMPHSVAASVASARIRSSASSSMAEPSPVSVPLPSLPPLTVRAIDAIANLMGELRPSSGASSGATRLNHDRRRPRRVSVGGSTGNSTMRASPANLMMSPP